MYVCILCWELSISFIDCFTHVRHKSARVDVWTYCLPTLGCPLQFTRIHAHSDIMDILTCYFFFFLVEMAHLKLDRSLARVRMCVLYYTSNERHLKCLPSALIMFADNSCMHSEFNVKWLDTCKRSMMEFPNVCDVLALYFR